MITAFQRWLFVSGILLTAPVLHAQPTLTSPAQAGRGSGEAIRLEILSVEGDAQAGGRPLRKGATLSLGDELKTGRDGQITAKQPDGSILTLRPGSAISVEPSMKSADHPAGGMLLRLKNGRMEVAAEKLPGSPPRFEVHTSNARILVFGTHFRVLANPEKRMATCEIFEGTAEVRDTGNLGTVTVPEGSGTRVLDGHPPSAPSELLPAPRLWKGVRMWIRRPIQLNFTRLQGATEYLVTVARNADFSSIVSETLFRSNVIDLSELANGPYFLKLRGIDKLGFEGRETTADLVLNFEEPKAPSGWALPR